MWSSLSQFCLWLCLRVEAIGALCNAQERLENLNDQATAGGLSGFEWVTLQRHLQELEQLISLQSELHLLQEKVEKAAAQNDPTIGDALCERLSLLYNQLALLEENLFLQEPYDASSALLLIYDAQDDTSMIFDDPPDSPGARWVDRLEKMYDRWSRTRNGGTRQLIRQGALRCTVDGRRFTPTILEVNVERAFGRLKNEAGIHRLPEAGEAFAVVEVYPSPPADGPVDYSQGYVRTKGYNGRRIRTIPLLHQNGQKLTVEYMTAGSAWAWYPRSTEEELAIRVLRAMALCDERRNDTLRRSYLGGANAHVRDHYTASSTDCFYDVLEKGALDPLLSMALRRPLSMLRCQRDFSY